MNLNYAYLQSTDDLDSISFCYNDSLEYCKKYGRLYTWAAAMDSVGIWNDNGKGCGFGGKSCSPLYPVRGVCPEGWHLPSYEEWETLLYAVGGKSTAGKMLKYIDGWNEFQGKIGNGDDAYSFSVLAAGYRDYYKMYGGVSYDNDGYSTSFWISSISGGYDAHYVKFDYDDETAYFSSNYNNDGRSIRCLKD